MEPVRPQTFGSVDWCGCLQPGVTLTKASSEPFGSPGTYLGFESRYHTAEQVQRGRDLSANQNSGEFMRTYRTTDIVCGCAGEIAGSDIGDHQFELQSRGGLEQVAVRRFPHEGEVRLVRGIAGVAAGVAFGGLIGLLAGRPGLGAALGAAIVGGSAAAAPMPSPTPSRWALNESGSTPPSSRPRLPLAYGLRPAAILELKPEPIVRGGRCLQRA